MADIPAGVMDIEDPTEQEIADLLRLEEESPDLLTLEESDTLNATMSADFDADDEKDFHVNLAKFMQSGELDRLASNVVQWVEDDKRSRQDWEDREAKGIRLLGVTKKTEGGANFKGASRSVHPGLMKACIQFQARAMAELWPSGGPAKTVVMGDITPEREEQAARVSDFMNFQYETEMPGAFEEHDAMLMRLPMTGSCFKKVYFDPLEQTVVSRFVESSDFFVPYSATDLRTAPRFTHRVPVVRNDLRKLIAEGVYLDVISEEPQQESYDHENIDDAIDDAEGRSPSDSTADNEAEQDQRDKLYECYCYLDLNDYEYSDPFGADGYGVPYIATVHRDEQRVLSIRRNWQESDPRQRRRLFFSHYKFLPGLGFYGFGLFHIAGGLSGSQTGALRALLDAAFLANVQGGYRSRDLKIEMADDTVEPGKWKTVDASAEEIARGFFTVPYKEPSKTLFELLGWMDGAMESLVSTTESMVGDENKAVPVGTTLARIEQGLKVFSGIHRRNHVAQQTELRIVADLDSEHMPQEYPYDVPGQTRSVYAQDFDDRVDVLPVSDPNIITNTQRIVTAEAVLEKANEAPDLLNRKQAYRNYLEALRVPDIDEYIAKDDEVPRMEPVAENMMMMTGQPVKVFVDQDHTAHGLTHKAWFESLPPEMSERLAPAYFAHQAEHAAQQYRLDMSERMGVEVPMPGEEIPPEMDAQLSQLAAMAMQDGGVQIIAPSTQEQGPDEQGALDVKTAADIQRQDAVAAADIERKDRIAQSDQERELAEQITRELIEGAQMGQAIENAERGRGGLSDAAAMMGAGSLQ